MLDAMSSLTERLRYDQTLNLLLDRDSGLLIRFTNDTKSDSSSSPSA